MRIRLMNDSISSEEHIAIKHVLDSGKYTQGPEVAAFEKEYAAWNGSKHAVMVNSGSSANLLIAMMLREYHGLSAGDEVLVPAVTWPTTVHPIIQHGMEPVFCDVDDSFNISVESMERMVTPRTKAVFVVHLLGQPADMGSILHFCEKHSLVLVEDSCETMGGVVNGRKTGTFGSMGSFSTYFGHHMTTIEGGIIVTDNDNLADLLRSARNHGWVRGSMRQDRYPSSAYNQFIFDMMGYNLRSTDLNAAIGREQLKKLDSWIETRRANHLHFIERCSQLPLTLQTIEPSQTAAFSLAVLFSDGPKRDNALRELDEAGIEARPIVAGNLCRQPVFERSNYRKDVLNKSDAIHERGIYLPNNQFIGKDEIDSMAHALEQIAGDRQ
jgi:CDP-4-dehydro-6-deoxyglucose reductase, E1